MRVRLSKLGNKRDDEGVMTSAKEWKDLGVGPLRLLKHKFNSKQRILMRNEKSGKIMLNTFMVPRMKFQRAKKNVQFMCMVEDFEVDKAGKLTQNKKLMSVLFAIKCNESTVAETLDRLTKAVPS